MRQAVLQVVMSGIGTLGFALWFHVRTRHLAVATLGGLFSWICYLAVLQVSGSLFLSAMLAAMLVCLWSEGAARLRKAPANIFLIPGIIPLLPGGNLYYAMSGLVNGEGGEFFRQGSATALIAVGITTGIVAASEIVNLSLELARARKRAGKSEHTKKFPFGYWNKARKRYNKK